MTKNYFIDHVHPIGRMPDQLESHALWHFIVTASKAERAIANEVEYEGEELHRTLHQRFTSILRGVCDVYSVTPEAIFRNQLVNAARAEIIRTGKSPSAKMPDSLLRWIQSKGKAEYMTEVADSWLKGSVH